MLRWEKFREGSKKMDKARIAGSKNVPFPDAWHWIKSSLQLNITIHICLTIFRKFALSHVRPGCRPLLYSRGPS